MVVFGKLFDRISNCLDFISSLVAVREKQVASKRFSKSYKFVAKYDYLCRNGLKLNTSIKVIVIVIVNVPLGQVLEIIIHKSEFSTGFR